MVSHEEVAAAFNAAAKALGVDGDELGDLLCTLSNLSEKELAFFPIGANAKAIVAFARSRRISGAAAGLSKESATGAGDSAMDALAEKLAAAAAAGTLKVLKPVLQHIYGPRSTSSVQSEYRPAALQHYTGELQPQYATCAVSGVRLEVKDVVAGHIYQQRWPPTKDVKINNPSNILLMHHKVKQHFDNFVFMVTPVALKVVLLHKKHKCKVLFEYKDNDGYQKSVKLGDLDGRLLALDHGTAPLEYALRIHAAWASKHALQQQWCSAADIPPTVGCDRELFQGFLRDSARGSSSGGDSGGGSRGDSGGGSRGDSGGGSRGDSGGGIGSSQDTNITGEAGATAEGGLSSSSGNHGSAGASDKLESALAVAAQQQLKL